ncbi:nucleotidyltransferase family protein [Sphingobacterium corticibacterium]|uniref:Nucleotidyltransferase family protein n=1 Tax=Sphingobacterium corticibacterium TaxID=2484746 RepID=A0A4Q6XI58_9SPHI|nr:nucleotidyltransferase family protein [Sphingobacterium corticibacterium]RZF58875.1 hypothetical protein EWE74_16260 [Sphingobacterium corticibacterium]
MTDKLRDIFFELLKMGLWGKGELSVGNPLSEEDWSLLYQYALNHTVEGVVFESFPLLKEAQLPPLVVRLKWTARVDQIERHNIRMNEVIAAQYVSFVKQGVSPILLKGQGVAQWYPNPLRRTSGDIDWCFNSGGYQKAEKFVREKGLSVHSPFGFSLDYDWAGIHIEHHSRVFDLKNPFLTAYLKKLLADSPLDTMQVNGQEVALLNPLLQIFQVNVHILKHLLGFGVGLRQICDAAVLYKAYKHRIDGAILREMYKKAGILKWVHQLHRILIHYIGLSEDDLPFPLPNDRRADWMMDEIWQSGNFGFYDARFAEGKVSFVSVQPDGLKRLWRSVRLYFPYAPAEALFFPIRRATARITALFSAQ